MKRVSAKLFFSVLWKGICQALAWFFGLFGYKREGVFAKCVWGLFAISGTVIITFIAVAMINALYYDVKREYRLCDGENCHWHTYISRNVTMHDHSDGKAWIKNTQTGQKTLTGIAWISKPLGEKDSLIVYSDGNNRGYFNKYTGEVAIPAKYKHAWVFSDGIASVEENGIIKFIDTKGNQAFERTFEYDPSYDGYVFHGGYCVVDEDNDKKYGLMNTVGVTILPEEYDQIKPANNLCYWTLTKGAESGVVDKDLKTVLPMMACAICVFDDEIDVTMADNTMRKYDMQGNLIDDFYISSFQYMEYELEETYQIVRKDYDRYDNEHEHVCTEHKKARARLCKYTAGNYKKGLMTQEGRIVTLPIYEYIEAVGPDTYTCTVSNGDMVVVNGKGEVVWN
ncbi:MAG: WG repeat-containing protein [Bacteroidales bacterium]|nr:WG repeat-containing protein [Candidatus Liminaster caballi]